MARKVILYIAMSLDGYIAKKDDNIDFLSQVERPHEDYGYTDFLKTIDTIVWGRKTFDKVLSFGDGVPHKNKKVYVVSKSKKGTQEHAVFHSDPIQLIHELQKQEGQNIYCDGGAEIIYQLLQKQLIDHIIVSIIPHLLGDGIKLFKEGAPEQQIQFKRSISFPSGLVQLWYDVKKV